MTSIIDSQVHAYAANTPDRPWSGVPNWPAHVSGDEMVAAMDAVGVDGAILVSALRKTPGDATKTLRIRVRQHLPPLFQRIGRVKPRQLDNPLQRHFGVDIRH